MANNQNLKPFTAENQPPAASKSRKGIPNRKTAVEKWGKVQIKFSNKNEDTGEKIFEDLKEEFKITLLDAVVLSLFQLAQGGNLKAIQEILDSLYGKIPNKQEISGAESEPIEVKQSYDLSKLSDEQSIEFHKLVELAYGDNALSNIIERIN